MGFLNFSALNHQPAKQRNSPVDKLQRSFLKHILGVRSRSPNWAVESETKRNFVKSLIYNDKRSSYQDLLTKDGSISIHHKIIQNVAIEMFKVKNSLAPKIVNDLLDNKTENYYNLSHRT